MAEDGVQAFRVTVSKGVYREFEIQSSKRLHDLAEAITDAFGFDFDHAFGFYSSLKGRWFDSPVRYELFADIGEESEAGSVKRTRIATAFPSVGDRMRFLFDYGDEWLFLVGVKYPRILKEVGTAPEQYPDPGDEDF
jgi:hypothetical protein